MVLVTVIAMAVSVLVVTVLHVMTVDGVGDVVVAGGRFWHEMVLVKPRHGCDASDGGQCWWRLLSYVVVAVLSDSGGYGDG